MQFLLYLTPDAQEVYELISRKITISENAPICKKYDIYGWFDSKKKTMFFCTDKILSRENVANDILVTLYHESSHVSQWCKSKSDYMIPLGISPIFLSSEKIKMVKDSVSINGDKVRKIEEEAFWLENKPEKIKDYLKKYCF